MIERSLESCPLDVENPALSSSFFGVTSECDHPPPERGRMGQLGTRLAETPALLTLHRESFCLSQLIRAHAESNPEAEDFCPFNECSPNVTRASKNEGSVSLNCGATAHDLEHGVGRC